MQLAECAKITQSTRAHVLQNLRLQAADCNWLRKYCINSNIKVNLHSIYPFFICFRPFFYVFAS